MTVYCSVFKIMRERESLFLIGGLLFIIVNVEVAQLISLLISSNDVHEVTQLVLLQELLGQILQVALAELDGAVDEDLGTVTTDGDSLAELAGLAVDLELVVQEVFL